MASVFTRIMAGELPGRTVYNDAFVSALLTIAPINPGHTLVVPRQEVEDWLDLDDETRDAVFAASQRVGRAIQRAFQPVKVAAIVAGLEVPHVHVHLIPIDSEAELSFARADHNADPAALDDAAARVRAEL